MFDKLFGLLDNPGRAVGIDPDRISPEDKIAYRAMVVQALANQIGGGTPFIQGLQSIKQGIDSQREAELKRQQMEAQMAQQRQLQGLFGQDPMQAAQAGAAQGALAAPVAEAGPVGPTVQRGQMQQASLANVDPRKLKAGQYRRAANVVAATSPETAKKYMDIADQLDPRPEYFAPTEGVGPDGKPAFMQFGKYGDQRAITGLAPKGPETPQDVRAVEYITGQSLKGTGPAGIAQVGNYRQQIAPKTTVSVPVSVNTEKEFASTMATEIGKQVAASAEQAAAAQSTLGTVQQVRQALPSAITGPGADVRTYIARLQNVLGVGGANDQERLANTARVLQGLAQAELNAAQQMKGQGQITEAEREIIRRAAAGQINMVPSEINALLAVAEKTAQSKIASHARNLQALRQMPGAAPITPFFELQGGVVPSTSPGGVPNIQEAARQELLRRQGGAR